MDTKSSQTYPALGEYSFKGITLPSIELPNAGGGTTTWVPLRDACRVLEFANQATAQENHVPPACRRKVIVQTSGGPQCFNFISEPGFYALALRSRAPVARDLRTWLTNEVMRSLRLDGAYTQVEVTA